MAEEKSRKDDSTDLMMFVCKKEERKEKEIFPQIEFVELALYFSCTHILTNTFFDRT